MTFKIDFQTQEAQTKVDNIAASVDTIAAKATAAGPALSSMANAMKMNASYVTQLKSVADSMDRISASSVKAMGIAGQVKAKEANTAATKKNTAAKLKQSEATQKLKDHEKALSMAENVKTKAGNTAATLKNATAKSIQSAEAARLKDHEKALSFAEETKTKAGNTAATLRNATAKSIQSAEAKRLSENEKALAMDEQIKTKVGNTAATLRNATAKSIQTAEAKRLKQNEEALSMAEQIKTKAGNTAATLKNATAKTIQGAEAKKLKDDETALAEVEAKKTKAANTAATLKNAAAKEIQSAEAARLKEKEEALSMAEQVKTKAGNTAATLKNATAKSIQSAEAARLKDHEKALDFAEETKTKAGNTAATLRNATAKSIQTAEAKRLKEEEKALSFAEEIKTKVGNTAATLKNATAKSIQTAEAKRLKEEEKALSMEEQVKTKVGNTAATLKNATAKTIQSAEAKRLSQNEKALAMDEQIKTKVGNTAATLKNATAKTIQAAEAKKVKDAETALSEAEGKKTKAANTAATLKNAAAKKQQASATIKQAWETRKLAAHEKALAAEETRAAKAAKDLAKANKTAAAAAKAQAKETDKLKKSLQGADQAAASMRAVLNASGTHMGIFTGRTIVTAAAFYAMTTAIKGVIMVGADFSKEMIRANRVMGSSVSEAAQLEAKVRDLGKNTIYTSGQVAAGLTFLAMAGLKPQEAIHALEPTLNVAKIGMIDFAKAADIVTNVMRAFYIPASEVGKVADVLAVSITNSNATLEQMAQALSFVAPIAAAVGDSVENVTAILTIFHDVGIKATRAGTSLRRAYSNLLSPSDKAQKSLRRLTTVTVDANGNMLSMITIMKNLAKSGATAADMVDLFGVRAAPAMVNLLRDLQQVNPKINEQVDLLYAAKGAAADLGNTLEQHLGADALKMVSALHDKFIELFNANEKGLRDMIKNTTEWIKSFDIKKIQSFIKGLMNLADWIRRNADHILTLTKYIIGLTVVRTLGALIGTFTGIFSMLNRVVLLVVSSLGAAIGRFTVLAGILRVAGMATAAMAGPIGWFIGAALLVGPPLYQWANGQVDVNNANEDGAKKLKKMNEELAKTKELLENRTLQDGLILPSQTMDTLKDARLIGKRPDEEISGATTTSHEDFQLASDKEKTDLAAQVQGLAKLITTRKELIDRYGKTQYQLIKDKEIYGKKFDEVALRMANQHNDDIVKWDSYIDAVVAEVGRLTRAISEREKLARKMAAAGDGVTQEGLLHREALQDTLDNAFGKTSFKDNADILIGQVKAAQANLNKLESVGIETSAEARNKIISLADDKLAQITRDFDIKKSAIEKDMKYYEDRGINITGDHVSGTLKDGAAFSKEDMAQYAALVAKWKALETEGKTVISTLNGIKEAAKLENVKDIFQDYKFFEAAIQADAFTNKLDEQIAAEKRRIDTMKSGVTTTENFISVSDRLAVAKQQDIYDLQEEFLIKARLSDLDPKHLQAMEDEHILLGLSLPLMKEKLRIWAALKKEAADQKTLESEKKTLSSGSFLKGQSKLDFDYKKDIKDLERYYELEAAAGNNSVLLHAEQMQARSEIDQEYWEKSHEQISKFFDSLGASMSKNISDVITYSQTWQEGVQGIRRAILGSLVGALVEVMVQKTKEWALELAFQKAKTAGTVVQGTTEIALENAKGAAATKTAVVEAAAGLDKSTMMAALIGEGAAVATAWAPAAVAVSAATSGENAIGAASGMMAIAAATLTAMSVVGAGALAIGATANAAGGARAQGGRVEKGKSYDVGELGREKFIADQNGFILSHAKLNQMEKANGQQPNYAVENRVGQSFQSEAPYVNVQIASPYEKTEPQLQAVASSSPLKEDSGFADREPVQVINVIDPELVRDYLGTEDGENVIVNIMRRNK